MAAAAKALVPPAAVSGAKIPQTGLRKDRNSRVLRNFNVERDYEISSGNSLDSGGAILFLFCYGAVCG